MLRSVKMFLGWTFCKNVSGLMIDKVDYCPRGVTHKSCFFFLVDGPTLYCRAKRGQPGLVVQTAVCRVGSTRTSEVCLSERWVKRQSTADKGKMRWVVAGRTTYTLMLSYPLPIIVKLEACFTIIKRMMVELPGIESIWAAPITYSCCVSRKDQDGI